MAFLILCLAYANAIGLMIDTPFLHKDIRYVLDYTFQTFFCPHNTACKQL